jgi:hypothetical protein
LSIKVTKSKFRLVIGATLTFKVPYVQLVEIRLSLISACNTSHTDF